MRALVKGNRIADKAKANNLIKRMKTEFEFVEEMCKESIQDSQPEVKKSCLFYLSY